MGDCREIIEKGRVLMGIEVTPDVVDRLCRYYGELIKWNRKINLVAKATEKKLIETHFLDSLALLKIITPDSFPSEHHLLDIGSGAGFPGLAVKAALPWLPVTLMEPRQKRVAFLRQVIRSLQCKDITVRTERLEPAKIDLEEEDKYSLITARAFTRMAQFLTLATPYCKAGGMIICMKGPQWQTEEKSFENIGNVLQRKESVQYRLPFSNRERWLVIYKKIAPQRE